MIAPDLDSAMASLQEMIGEANVILPFTGAGISTECGIPDFRSPGGIWTKNRPILFDEFLAQPGGAQRILAAPLRHGRRVRPCQAGPGPSGAGEPLPRRAKCRR